MHSEIMTILDLHLHWQDKWPIGYEWLEDKNPLTAIFNAGLTAMQYDHVWPGKDCKCVEHDISPVEIILEEEEY